MTDQKQLQETTIQALNRLGIEATERDRIRRGLTFEQLDTEWVRQRAGLPELTRQEYEKVKRKAW